MCITAFTYKYKCRPIQLMIIKREINKYNFQNFFQSNLSDDVYTV